ncbi:UDP-N-acetylmuramoyl-L-alanyl-D-glutamate--2,6-diaminopimelate ligase [Halobacillus mangrovi]|uniref:UDP-N-acetylmuramyl-tripeptide synthetase n=1 Tax=Halobacillus mangrovi TaxID=402384 RepID=A0A1W5ZZF8_9BACI|nr:UDP-N-acetylmuramoyl-L-alanyl-D-glutamate--2,6-diaminopimelate ligase [Halobacillus mangrovi]ARI78640.1 UDP-N-acetylmuramoyl-L-alanyl-D-glutamate--2,6-diaminopimelate ligase [Halobacillus mangrovi]
MKLQDLVYELETRMKLTTINIDEDITVEGLADNSREVKENYLFVAVKGFDKDGHSYINQAVRDGVSVVIGEEDLADEVGVPYIKVPNSRRALGILSNKFYHFPAKDKWLIGITGTNGKTTTSYLLKEIIESSGKSCAVIGSIQNIVNGRVYPTQNTTPSSLKINQMLAISTDDVVIIEVTSHALTQYRVEGLAFDMALFTNLSHDHLDYHSSMEEYFEAKRRLFHMLKKEGKAVINTDDSWGAHLERLLKDEGKPVFTVGKEEGRDFQIAQTEANPPKLLIKDKNGETTIYSNMSGMHNMYNMTMSFAAAALVGLDKALIGEAIEKFEGVKGRFQMIKIDEVTAVVDYAHTPDAIYHCLNTARQAGARKIIHVFGFRGDRDSTKRREMVAITSEISDHYILTFDDLNSVSGEEMGEVLRQLQDMHGNEKGKVITDRTLAIREAIELADDGDWILVTGKGNESYQLNYSLPTDSDEETLHYFALEQSRG